MNVLLISANTEAINMPAIPMGLGCVAASTAAAGHRVRLLDLLIEDDPKSAVDAAIKAERPEAIGISVRNIDDQCMQAPRFLLEGVRDTVARCRALSTAPVILGGPGYSIFPDACLEYLHADMGIRGEGEAAFPALLAVVAAGGDPTEIAGVAARGGQASAAPKRIAELDRFLPPEPAWFSASVYRSADFWLPVQTRRGCPLNCSYCSTPAIEGALIRRRGAAAVVDFLQDWRDAGFTKVFFVDNTFNLPPSFARSLCREMVRKSLDVAWRCILYPAKVSGALVQDMAEAGCCEVSLGFESGDPAMLDAMNKQFGPADIRRTARLLADAGIRQMGFLLLGGPGETRESVKRSIEFVERLGLDMVKVTVGVRIYPETRVAEIARQKGVVGTDDDLLYPRFYLEPGLEGWLFDFARQAVDDRAGWLL